MRNPLVRFPVRWVLLGAAILVLAGVTFSSIGKPPDEVRKMNLSPKFYRSGRDLIISQSNRKGLRHQPRYVTLQSNGPKFRAYLLDLSSIKDSRAKVDAFMKATEEVGRGEEPTTAPIKDKAVNVAEAHFRLSSFPWSLTTIYYMLIVGSDEEIEVAIRVNYGR